MKCHFLWSRMKKTSSFFVLFMTILPLLSFLFQINQIISICHVVFDCVIWLGWPDTMFHARLSARKILRYELFIAHNFVEGLCVTACRPFDQIQRIWSCKDFSLLFHPDLHYFGLQRPYWPWTVIIWTLKIKMHPLLSFFLIYIYFYFLFLFYFLFNIISNFWFCHFYNFDFCHFFYFQY